MSLQQFVPLQNMCVHSQQRMHRITVKCMCTSCTHVSACLIHTHMPVSVLCRCVCISMGYKALKIMPGTYQAPSKCWLFLSLIDLFTHVNLCVLGAHRCVHVCIQAGIVTIPVHMLVMPTSTWMCVRLSMHLGFLAHSQWRPAGQLQPGPILPSHGAALRG